MFILKKKYYKDLNKIAIPLIIQNITGMLIGLVDQMFLGRISTEAYGAIGISVSFMYFLAGIFGYFAVGFNIEGAKTKSQNDEEKFLQYFISSFLLDIIIGILYFIFIFICAHPLFKIVYDLSGEALSAAITYSFITSPYILLQLFIFTYSSYFKIIKKTHILLISSTVSLLINTVLDYFLIFGKLCFPKMGTAGAALSSIFSVFLNVCILIFYDRKYIKSLLSSFAVSKNIFYDLIKKSLPLVGSELLEGTLFVVAINAIISHIGVMEISAFLLVKNFIDIICISMFMYASAEMTLSSEYIGKNRLSEIKSLTLNGIIISELIYLILGVILVLFRNNAPKIISNDSELIALAATLIIPMFFMNLFNPVQTIYKYVLQACNESKFVLYITAIINLAIVLVIILLQLIKQNIFWIFAGLFINYFTLTIIYSIRLNKQIKTSN